MLIVPSGPYMEGTLKHVVKCTALCSWLGPAPHPVQGQIDYCVIASCKVRVGGDRAARSSLRGISQQLVTFVFAPYLNLVPSTDNL